MNIELKRGFGATFLAIGIATIVCGTLRRALAKDSGGVGNVPIVNRIPGRTAGVDTASVIRDGKLILDSGVGL